MRTQTCTIYSITLLTGANTKHIDIHSRVIPSLPACLSLKAVTLAKTITLSSLLRQIPSQKDPLSDSIL